jgi:hypothetical protein
MTKYYVEFKEKQIHAYGYYTEANSPEEAFELAEDRYFNDATPDSQEILDARYFEHKIEEA